MTENVFSSILEIGLTTGVFILLVTALRGLFRRAPHRIFVLLWLVVGIRLLVPVNVESPVSAWGFAEQWRTAQNEKKEFLPAGTDPAAEAHSPVKPEGLRPSAGQADAVRPTAEGDGLTDLGSASMKQSGQTGAERPTEQSEWADAEHPAEQTSGFDWKKPAGMIWLCGVALMLAYGGIRWLRLRGRMRDAVRYDGNVWQSDRIETPFVFGILRPRIYVPFGIGEKLPYVLTHERTHLRHGDHIIKALWFAVLALYWFHPLVWLAYGLLGRDMELACDERVIAGLNDQEKGGYARALLELSMGKKALALNPLAFGEVGVKMRIIHVLNYKKPAIFAALATLVIGAVFAAVLLTDPKASNAQPEGGNEEPQNPQDPEDDTGVTDMTSGEDEDITGWDDSYPVIALGESAFVGNLAFDTYYLADLDGDGKNERICAAFLPAEEALVVEVASSDGEVRTGRLGAYDIPQTAGRAQKLGKEDFDCAVDLENGLVFPWTDRYYLVDMDKNDSYLELAFASEGPSADPTTDFVRFDGQLKYVGCISSHLEEDTTTIAGDGIIWAKTRCDLIQTDWIIGKWQLVNGRLEYQAPDEAEFLYAEGQYQGEMPVVAGRDFTAWPQNPLLSASCPVKKGTKLCIQGYRRGDKDACGGGADRGYWIDFYYYDADWAPDGSRIDACVYLHDPFGQIDLVGESVADQWELFEGLNMVD